MPVRHVLNPSPETIHWGHFDAKIPARLEVDSGDTVVVDTVSGWGDVIDVSLLRPDHLEIVTKMKPILGPHILTGPIAVRGALPGDVLEVRIQAIELTVDWGWNIIRPLRGTLPEDFPNFERRTLPLDRKAMTTKLPWGPTIPLRPFFGILATAPRPEYGMISSVEPREFGGNIDCREFDPGTSLFLPVFVPGANFSAGDGHAVQGDGEVCLTALETCLKGTFELVLRKDMRLAMPRAITPTHYITFGLDLDLDDAAKQALRDMIAWLVQMGGWTPSEAYVFCSLACDLHVTQLVDGNKGIHAMVNRNLVG
ncbi:MAG: acetamidase/formamidase family protein [Candidatus Rokubacteria bacterium]|nr:acetamidase/formamidase family protein [Candidatus Rokubacteria bacterium]MBI2554047.1 acetamidase/formamidase family protein [Candidatus Rokubacteria bacterium]